MAPGAGRPGRPAAAPGRSCWRTRSSTGGEASESERDISVGGVATVPRRSSTGSTTPRSGTCTAPSGSAEQVRYSGSPLPYSFSEEHHRKAGALVELGADGPRRRRAACRRRCTARWPGCRGRLDDLLTDRGSGRLRGPLPAGDADRPGRGRASRWSGCARRFPHVLVLGFAPEGADRRDGSSYATRLRGRSDLEVATEFVDARPRPGASRPRRRCWPRRSRPCARGRGGALMRLHRLEVTAFGPFAGTETVDFDALADGRAVPVHRRHRRRQDQRPRRRLLRALRPGPRRPRRGPRLCAATTPPTACAPEVVLEVTPARPAAAGDPVAGVGPAQAARAPAPRPSRPGCMLEERAAAGWRTLSTRLDEAGAPGRRAARADRWPSSARWCCCPRASSRSSCAPTPSSAASCWRACSTPAGSPTVERWLVDRRQETARALDERRRSGSRQVLARVAEAAGEERARATWTARRRRRLGRRRCWTQARGSARTAPSGRGAAAASGTRPRPRPWQSATLVAEAHSAADAACTARLAVLTPPRPSRRRRRRARGRPGGRPRRAAGRRGGPAAGRARAPRRRGRGRRLAAPAPTGPPDGRRSGRPGGLDRAGPRRAPRGGRRCARWPARARGRAAGCRHRRPRAAGRRARRPRRSGWQPDSTRAGARKAALEAARDREPGGAAAACPVPGRRWRRPRRG